jgi:hypothetical protein
MIPLYKSKGNYFRLILCTDNTEVIKSGNQKMQELQLDNFAKDTAKKTRPLMFLQCPPGAS